MSETMFIVMGKVLKEKVMIEYLKKDAPKTKKGKLPQVDYEHNETPHPDLIAAFARLNVHLAAISECVPKKTIKKVLDPPESVQDFKATGFHIKGQENDIQAFKLHGYKTLSTSKVLGLDCPGERNVDYDKNDKDEDAYLFIDDLREAVALCQRELELYMEGKKADDPQQSIGFPEGGSAENNEDEEQ